MNDEKSQYVEAVGERLKARGLSPCKDNVREWIWIVGAEGAITVDAYVALPLNADDASTDQVAAYISRILLIDPSVLLMFYCHWHIVLCGTGWDNEQIAAIQANIKPREVGDQVEVLLLENV